jgi:hypothetical protein
VERTFLMDPQEDGHDSAVLSMDFSKENATGPKSTTGAWIAGDHTGINTHEACIAVTGISAAVTGNGTASGHDSAAGGWICGNNTGMDTHGACINIEKEQAIPFDAKNSGIALIDTGSTAGIGTVSASLRVTTGSSTSTGNVLSMNFLNSAETGHGAAGIGTGSAGICVATCSSIGTSGISFMGSLNGATAGRGNATGVWIGGNHTDTYTHEASMAITSIGVTGQDNAAGGWTSGIAGTITHGVCINTEGRLVTNNGSFAVNDSTISAADIGFTPAKATQVAPSGLHDSGNMSIDGAISITVWEAEHVASTGTTYNANSKDAGISTASGYNSWTGHRDFDNGRVGVAIGVTRHDESQDVLIRADEDTGIGTATGVAIREANQVTLAINRDSIGTVAVALGITNGEVTQATLTAIGEDDQVAWSDAIKSTPWTKGPTSLVPTVVKKAPLFKARVTNTYDSMGRIFSFDHHTRGQPHLGCVAKAKPHYGMASQSEVPKNFKYTLCLDKQSEYQTSNEWGVSNM